MTAFPNFSIRRLAEVSSTNSLAREYARKGAKEGLVLSADFQTHGRGKPGRVWVSPPGKNLLVSILLRPAVAAHKAPMITQIACRTVAKVLRDQYGIDSAFKRPNDILVGGKKICGVLTESSTSSGRLENVIIGIGLNVNSGPGELPPEATSIKNVKHREYKRERLLKALLLQLKKDMAPFYAHPA